MGHQLIQSSKVNNPTVSVIVPMYNVEHYIESTIQSLMKQTLDHLELILIDDGSSDRTVEIIKKLVQKNDNVTFIIKDNSGPGATRNLGMKYAQGEYIGFVDSDDLLPEDALLSMYQVAKNKNVQLVTGMSQSFNKKKRWFINSHVNEGAYEEGMKDLFHHPGMLYTIGPCNKLFKRELLNGIEFPSDIKVTEDHPFVIEAYLKAKKFYTLDKIIYYYRQRDNENNVSLSQIVNSDSVAVIVDIMNSLRISDQLWGKYEENPTKKQQMQINYYDRIIRADLWPAILKSINRKNTKDLEKIFRLLENWIKEMDSELLAKTTSISRMLQFQMVNKYKKLPKKIKKQYRSLLQIYREKVSPSRMIHLKAFQSFLFYFTKSSFNKIHTMFCQITINMTIKLSSVIAKFLPLKKDKLIFITLRENNANDDYGKVLNQLTHNNKKSIEYFNMKNRFFKLCKFYFDLSTANYLIADDYFFHTVKMRAASKKIRIWDINKENNLTTKDII